MAQARSPHAPLQVIRAAEAFRQVLAQPWCARTAHFAAHHLQAVRREEPPLSPPRDLSSAGGHNPARPVDNFLDKPVNKSVEELPSTLGQAAPQVGFVIPKRWARRSVTRNLLRRQMRQALIEHRDALPSGLWVLRLRSVFDPAQFPSAASPALRKAAREELRHLLSRALRGQVARGGEPC